MSVWDVQSAILACFYPPCPLEMEQKAYQKGHEVVKVLLKTLDWFLKVTWKYILHAFHWATHLDYQCFYVCTKACRQICVWRNGEAKKICFVVVGLPAHAYVWSPKLCCEKNGWKCDFWQWDEWGGNAFLNAHVRAQWERLDLSQYRCGYYVQ